MTRVLKTEKFYNASSWLYNPLLHLFFHKGRKLVSKEINYGGFTYDLGCHQGQMYRLIQPSDKYLGMDIANKCILIAKEKYPQGEFICADIYDFNQQVYRNDQVLLLYVLSVCDKPKEFIEQLSKNLSVGARIHVVNHFSSHFLFRILDGLLSKLFYSGVNFYFPLKDLELSKDFTFVSKKSVNWFWTYLILEKK